MSSDSTPLVVGGGPAGVTAAAETVQTVAACMAANMTVDRVAELQLAFPTFTEAVCMAAQKICRTLGIGHFPQVWSYLGPEDGRAAVHGDRRRAVTQVRQRRSRS
jgi:hypothetical protein